MGFFQSNLKLWELWQLHSLHSHPPHHPTLGASQFLLAYWIAKPIGTPRRETLCLQLVKIMRQITECKPFVYNRQVQPWRGSSSFEQWANFILFHPEFDQFTIVGVQRACENLILQPAIYWREFQQARSSTFWCQIRISFLLFILLECARLCTLYCGCFPSGYARNNACVCMIYTCKLLANSVLCWLNVDNA